MRFIKKWIAILLSLSISLIVLYLISFPLMSLSFIGIKLYKDSYPVLYHYLSIGLPFIPIIILSIIFYFQLNKNIFKMINESLITENILNIEEKVVLLEDFNKTYKDPINEKIKNVFIEAKKKLNISKNIYLIRVKEEENVNAFAVSNIKGEGAIVVFDGLAKNIDDKLLKAVIGHELGHIKNKDSITHIMLYSSQNLIYSLYNLTNRFSFIINRLSSIIPILGIFVTLFLGIYNLFAIFVISISSFIVKYINLFESRESEYLADKVGANVSSKESMVEILSMLDKLEQNSNKRKKIFNLFDFLKSTHPSYEKRIANLINE
jgi:Zn-dependent protease with chaperone function